MPIINNRKHGKAVLIVNANDTSTVNSFSTGVGEIVDRVVINAVYWTGQWTVARGSNTYISTPASSSGKWEFSDNGIALDMDSTANIVSTLTGSGTLVLLVDKDSTNE